LCVLDQQSIQFDATLMMLTYLIGDHLSFSAITNTRFMPIYNTVVTLAYAFVCEKAIMQTAV